MLPQVVEHNAQAHPERSEQVRENSRFMATLFLAAEKKSGRGRLSLMITATPIGEEDRTLTGKALLHQIAEDARQHNSSDRYFDEPREKTYGGRRLWQSDLQRPQSSSIAFMREVVFVHRGLLVVVVGGAPDRAVPWKTSKESTRLCASLNLKSSAINGRALATTIPIYFVPRSQDRAA